MDPPAAPAAAAGNVGGRWRESQHLLPFLGGSFFGGRGPPPPQPLTPHPFPPAGFGSSNDPFSTGSAGLSKSKVHIRIQQRNGRKCITSIQGLEDDLDLKRICKAMKRSFNANGNVAEDEEMGHVIQLQGDQRDNAKEWLLAQEIILPAEADRIVIHGF
jgi:translation initiation factor 1